MREDLLKIIKHYGVLPQLKYLQSEVFELNEAIIYERATSKYGDEINDYKCIEHITEELADVLVMVYQFVEYYKIDQVELFKKMGFKIDRQLERITEEEEVNYLLEKESDK